MCVNISTPKAINFPFGSNRKLVVLGVSILNHYRAYYIGAKIFMPQISGLSEPLYIINM